MGNVSWGIKNSDRDTAGGTARGCCRQHLTKLCEGWIVATPDRRKFAVRIKSYPELDIANPATAYFRAVRLERDWGRGYRAGGTTVAETSIWKRSCIIRMEDAGQMLLKYTMVLPVRTHVSYSILAPCRPRSNATAKACPSPPPIGHLRSVRGRILRWTPCTACWWIL